MHRMLWVMLIAIVGCTEAPVDLHQECTALAVECRETSAFVSKNNTISITRISSSEPLTAGRWMESAANITSPMSTIFLATTSSLASIAIVDPEMSIGSKSTTR